MSPETEPKAGKMISLERVQQVLDLFRNDAIVNMEDSRRRISVSISISVKRPLTKRLDGEIERYWQELHDAAMRESLIENLAKEFGVLQAPKVEATISLEKAQEILEAPYERALSDTSYHGGKILAIMEVDLENPLDKPRNEEVEEHWQKLHNAAVKEELIEELVDELGVELQGPED
jgi:hypothetical protein